MSRIRWIALAGVLLASPQLASAQGFEGRPERRVAWLSDQLREQMWAYRQGLDFFRSAPEYQQLVDLRYRLRQLAVEVAQGGEVAAHHGPARQMDEVARQLYTLTRQLEGRTDLGARDEVRRRADQLTEYAVEIRVLIGRIHEAVRLDYPGVGRGTRDGAPVVIPRTPAVRPGDRR